MLLQIFNKILLIFIVVVPNLYLLLIFYKFKKQLKELLPFIILLILFSVVFFNKLIFKDQTLAAQDFNNIQITFFDFFRESIVKYKQPPIWNSRFGGGFDAFSNPISAYFSPLNFLFILIPNVYTAANFFVLGQLILISIFSLFLFRKIGFSKSVAFFGAVVFTFNGFVTMRLSPGVGIEYLYSYKWIPLILTFTLMYFEDRKLENLSLLAVSLAFTFEGNLNIAISIWFLWVLFVVVLRGRFVFKDIKKIVFIPILSFVIYAVKILPGIDLMINSSGRISGTVSGWRTNKMEILEFPSYFPPFSHIFGTAVFTPGVVAFLFFMVCVVVLMFNLFRKKKIDIILKFCFVSILFGFLLTTYNPFSDFLFLLPPFNRLTISPAFMVFIFVPMYMMSVYGVDIASKFILKHLKFKNSALIEGFIIFGVSCLVFAEVLLGPSTFGANTYSFNFAKMDKAEIYEVPPYNILKDLEPGIFVFADNPNVFLYPYEVSLLNLYTLNNFKYFYGPSGGNNLLKDGKLEDIKNHADYVLSSSQISDSDLILVKVIGTENLLHNFKSYSILDKKYDYLDLQSKMAWSEEIFLYKVNRKADDVLYLKSLDNNPVSVVFNIKDRNISSYGSVSSSVSYSRWWRSDSKKLSLEKDSFGYLKISNVESGYKVNLFYFNPFIYIGLALSTLGFLLVSRYILWDKHRLTL